ncbi:MAG: Ig-like domain-containing protein [Acidimicrobiales bacterium]
MHRIFRKYVTSLLVVPGVVLGVMFGALAIAPTSSAAAGKVALTRASLVSAKPQDAGTVTAENSSFSTSTGVALTEPAGTLYAGDSDTDANPANQCCTATLYTEASNGTVALDSPEDGGFTYTPDSGFTGSDSFQFVLSDTDGNVSAPATVTVDVTAVTAQPDTYYIDSGQALSVPAGILQTGATDADGSATCCTASLAAPASDGTVSVDSNGDGGFTYTPDNGFAGTDTFTYTLTDSSGNVSAPTPVTMTVSNPAATTTTIVETDPPAASTSTPVTIAAQVAPASGSGPLPTGSVTFTYYTVGLERGGPFTGSLGSAAINGNGVAKITTTPGQLPPGGPLNGSLTLKVTYNGSGTYAASTGLINYFVVPGCFEGQWGKRSNGYPDVIANGPTGYYIGQSNGWYTVYVTQNSASSLNFSGNVTTNGLIIDVSEVKNSGTGFLKLQGQLGTYRLGWKMSDKSDVDGFTFFAGCGSEVKFTLKIGSPATPATTSQIFIGANGVNGGTGGVLTVKRKD